MKRAATKLFKRQSKNRAFFSKLSNFYFDFKTPRVRQRSDNPTPGATRMCESRGSPGGMVRLGFYGLVYEERRLQGIRKQTRTA